MLLVKILGSKNSVVCIREGEANTTPYFYVAYFALRNAKFGGGRKRGRAKNFLPLNQYERNLYWDFCFW